MLDHAVDVKGLPWWNNDQRMRIEIDGEGLSNAESSAPLNRIVNGRQLFRLKRKSPARADKTFGQPDKIDFQRRKQPVELVLRNFRGGPIIYLLLFSYYVCSVLLMCR